MMAITIDFEWCEWRKYCKMKSTTAAMLPLLAYACFVWIYNKRLLASTRKSKKAQH